MRAYRRTAWVVPPRSRRGASTGPSADRGRAAARSRCRRTRENWATGLPRSRSRGRWRHRAPRAPSPRAPWRVTARPACARPGGRAAQLAPTKESRSADAVSTVRRRAFMKIVRRFRENAGEAPCRHPAERLDARRTAPVIIVPMNRGDALASTAQRRPSSPWPGRARGTLARRLHPPCSRHRAEPSFESRRSTEIHRVEGSAAMLVSCGGMMQ